MTEAELGDLEECSQMFDFDGFMPEESRRLLAEVHRLREALSEFGEHQCVLPRGCPKWAKPLDRDAVCTCGLDAALIGTDASG